MQASREMPELEPRPMSAMPAMTRDPGDSQGLLYWKCLVSTFVTTKFSHVAGRMVAQCLDWRGRV